MAHVQNAQLAQRCKTATRLLAQAERGPLGLRASGTEVGDIQRRGKSKTTIIIFIISSNIANNAHRHRFLGRLLSFIRPRILLHIRILLIICPLIVTSCLDVLLLDMPCAGKGKHRVARYQMPLPGCATSNAGSM